MLPPGVCLSPQLMLLWVSSRKEATIDGAAQIVRVSLHAALQIKIPHFDRLSTPKKEGIFMNKLLYGVAYYYEYLPYDRLAEDIKMMKAAGINVVRIAESTWSTYEKQEGQFDFSTVTKVLDAMEEAGIDVIIGTPTYAVPSW